MSLGGKRAVVTGGGRGIGRAIAEGLRAAGADVLIAGRNPERLAAAAADLGAQAIAVDLADRADTDRFARELAGRGPCDILVNNAGIAESAPLGKIDDDLWDRHLEINATAVFRLCRALVPGMIERGWGRIVTIASSAGVTGYRYSAAYCTSKHAVVGFTRALAIDLGTSGVTVNAVCPGWVDTDMSREAASRIASATGRSEEQARAALAGMSPQGRLIDPSEVAHLVVSLCAEEARSIHGQALLIDGGSILK